jgi:transcription initiation factor TFIIIB Brf1 subunit/transcription initiation factor TFIIB
MAEEKVKSLIPKFQEKLNLGPLFSNIYEQLLHSDRENIKPENASYPAAMAYVANLMIGSNKSQEEISVIANCSVKDLRDEYRGIVARNRAKIIELS